MSPVCNPFMIPQGFPRIAEAWSNMDDLLLRTGTPQVYGSHTRLSIPQMNAMCDEECWKPSSIETLVLTHSIAFPITGWCTNRDASYYHQFPSYPIEASSPFPYVSRPRRTESTNFLVSLYWPSFWDNEVRVQHRNGCVPQWSNLLFVRSLRTTEDWHSFGVRVEWPSFSDCFLLDLGVDP